MASQVKNLWKTQWNTDIWLSLIPSDNYQYPSYGSFILKYTAIQLPMLHRYICLENFSHCSSYYSFKTNTRSIDTMIFESQKIKWREKYQNKRFAFPQIGDTPNSLPTLNFVMCMCNCMDKIYITSIIIYSQRMTAHLGT